jgi:hypothetical protein
VRWYQPSRDTMALLPHAVIPSRAISWSSPSHRLCHQDRAP